MPRFALLRIQQWNLKLHISSSLKGFPITQNSLAWSTLAPWLIKSLWNRLCYNTSLLLRARGRSGGRLCLFYKLLGFPAKEQNQQRMSKGYLWMRPDSAGTNVRARPRPETEAKCCSVPLCSWHPRALPVGRVRLKITWTRGAVEWDSCRQEAQPELWPSCFCYSSSTLPWALLPSGTMGSWERDLLWQRQGRFPPWLTSVSDNPLPLQLCWKLLLPANLENLGLSHLHLQKSLVSHK